MSRWTKLTGLDLVCCFNYELICFCAFLVNVDKSIIITNSNVIRKLRIELTLLDYFKMKKIGN